MAKLKKTSKTEDIFRLGCYAQMEGSVTVSQSQFKFYRQQISDIDNLVERVVDIPLEEMNNRTFLQFRCVDLINELKYLGFYKFNVHDWNFPKATEKNEDLKKEHLRAVVDALGTVDVDKSTPYVKVQSVNTDSLVKIHTIHGGNLRLYGDTNYLEWKGDAALEICSYLDWKFYCYRNMRGAQLIKNIKWENFVW